MHLFLPARRGLGAAWAVSAACFAALAAARERSMKAFLWTYGGGLAARVLVLAHEAWVVLHALVHENRKPRYFFERRLGACERLLRSGLDPGIIGLRPVCGG